MTTGSATSIGPVAASSMSRSVREASIATTVWSAGVSSLKPAGKFDVARSDVLVQAEFGNVDLEVLGNLIRRTFDFERVRDDVHHAARVPDAACDADGYDRTLRRDRFVGRNAQQIRMQHFVRHRVALNLAHERGFRFAGSAGLA